MKYWKEKNVEEKLKEISDTTYKYLSGPNLLKAWTDTSSFSIKNNELVKDLIEMADEAIKDIHKLFGNPYYNNHVIISTLITAFAKWQCNYTTVITILQDIINGKLLNFEVDNGKEIRYGNTTNIKLVVAGDIDVSAFEVNIITKLNVKEMLYESCYDAFLNSDYIMGKFDEFDNSYLLDITGLIKDYEAKAEFDRTSYFNDCKNVFCDAVINKNIINADNYDNPSEPDLIGNQYITFNQFISNINNIVTYPYSSIDKLVFNRKILYRAYDLIHNCTFGISDNCYIIGTCESAETCPIRNMAELLYHIDDLDNSDIDHILKSTYTWGDIKCKFTTIKLRKVAEEENRKREEERVRVEIQRKLDEEKYLVTKNKEEEKNKQEKIDKDNRMYNEILKEEKLFKKENIRKEIISRRKNYVLDDLGNNPCPIVCFADDYLESTPGGFKIIMILNSSIPKDKQKEYISKLDLYHICIDKLDEDLKLHNYKTGEKRTAMNIAPLCYISKSYINGAGTILYILFELKENARNTLLDIIVDDAVKKQIKNIGKKDRVYINKNKRKALRAHILFNFNLNAVKFKDKDQIVEDIIDILNKYYNDITKENVDKAIQYLLDHYLIINDLKSFNLEEELVAAV